jgi:hypothetical protein
MTLNPLCLYVDSCKASGKTDCDGCPNLAVKGDKP